MKSKTLVLTSPTPKVRLRAEDAPPGHRIRNNRFILNRGWIDDKIRFAIYLRDNFTCLACGADLRDCARSEFGLDHLITRFSKGSNDNPSNLVTCCRSCNSRRGDRPWREFYTPAQQKIVDRKRRQKLDLKRAASYLKRPKQLKLFDKRPGAQCELHFD